MALLNRVSCVLLQILEVNGQSFENLLLSKAMEILKGQLQLTMSVKTNLLGVTTHPNTHTHTYTGTLTHKFLYLLHLS